MKLLFVALVVAVLGSLLGGDTTSAQVTLDTICNSTTGIYTEILRNGSAIAYNNSFTCALGCANPVNGTTSLVCNLPAAPMNIMTIGIVVMLVAFLFIFISTRIVPEYKALQVLFLIGALLFSILDISIVAGFNTLTTNSLNNLINSAYIISIGIFSMVILMVFISMLLKILYSVNPKRR